MLADSLSSVSAIRLRTGLFHQNRHHWIPFIGSMCSLILITFFILRFIDQMQQVNTISTTNEYEVGTPKQFFNDDEVHGKFASPADGMQFALTVDLWYIPYQDDQPT